MAPLTRPWCLSALLCLGAGLPAGCRSGPPGRPAAGLAGADLEAQQVQADLAAANEGPGPRLSLVATGSVAGVRVEQYRLGEASDVVLLPDPAARAVTVQVWLQRGWADDPPGARGRAEAWAHHGWAAPVPAPARRWVGVTRDLSAAVAVGAPPQLPALLDWAAAPWRAAGPTPAPPKEAGPGALRRRLRRTWVEVLSSGGKVACDRPGPSLWVVAGPVSRTSTLRALRRAAPTTAGCPAAALLAVVGPRAPVEVRAEGEARVALLGWSLPSADPAGLAHLRALALLLGGPTRRLAPALEAAHLPGLELLTEVGPRGRALEVFAALGPTATATTAAAQVRAQLTEIGRGATTGLQLEQVQASLRADALRSWASLEGRGQLVAELLLADGEGTVADRVAAYLTAAQAPAEVDLRALARKLAQRPPVLVVGQEDAP